MKTVEIGCAENPKIGITVLSYERTPTGDLYDDNWVISRVAINIGGFTAKFSASFLTQDFVRFRTQVQSLFDTLNGQAGFDPLEHQLEIKLAGNGRGGIEVSGKAVDLLGGENELAFSFQIDQTHLPHTIRGLNELISEFPTRPA